MSGHKWVEIEANLWRCENEGCGIRRFEHGGGREVWQKKERAHWHAVAAKPIPDCAKEVTP